MSALIQHISCVQCLTTCFTWLRVYDYICVKARIHRSVGMSGGESRDCVMQWPARSKERQRGDWVAEVEFGKQTTVE